MEAVVGCVVFAPVAVVLALRWYITRAPLCPNTNKLTGKIIIITGATSGIGLAAAEECAAREATVVLACRDRARAEAAVTDIRTKTRNQNVHFLPLDLSRLHTVVEFCELFLQRYNTHPHVLVNNAAYLGPRQVTEDKLDLIFQTNVLGPFLLSELLIRHGKPSPQHPLRIVNVVSDSLKLGQLDLEDLQYDRRPYELYPVYGTSKLALLLLTIETNCRYGDRGVEATAVHPGAVRSGLQRHWPGILGALLRLVARLLFRSPRAGAQGLLHAITLPRLGPLQGKVIHDCGEWGGLAGWRHDPKQAQGLWARCQALAHSAHPPDACTHCNADSHE